MSSIETAKNPRDVVLRPVVTEKSSAQMDQGKYTFEVDPRANKTEIRLAVESIFDVQVASVATQTRVGKVVRSKTGLGRRKQVKRAIVTLREGTIDVFGGTQG